MARSRNTADTQTASGGPVSPFIAGKNAVINGGMDIWQRGTSISVAASSGITYTADRWCLNTGANQAITISRQATGDTTNLPNIQYCIRYQRNSGQTGTGGLFISQSIESVNSIPLAGKTVTFSFYARAGANYSAASSALTVLLYTGTGTDQNQLSGFTGSATPISGTATLTTTWQRFTFTGTIASTVTEIASTFYFTPVGTAGAADYYEVTGVQLELGSSATPFSRAGGTIQGELAACQRYYEKSINQSLTPGTSGNVGEIWFPNGTIIPGETWQTPRFAVTKRTSPTVTTYSYNGTTSRASDNNGTDYVADSANVWRASETGFDIKNNGASNMTVAAVRWVYCNWAASAEL